LKRVAPIGLASRDAPASGRREDRILPGLARQRTDATVIDLKNGVNQMAITANWSSLQRVAVRDGVNRRVFAGQNSMMVLNELMPSAKPALHRHPHEQLSYIIAGTCRFVVGDDVLDMAAGDVVLIPPDTPHALEVTGSRPVLNLDVFSPIREEYLQGFPANRT